MRVRGKVEEKHRNFLLWGPFEKGLGWEKRAPKHLPALGFHIVRCFLQPEDKEMKARSWSRGEKGI